MSGPATFTAIGVVTTGLYEDGFPYINGGGGNVTITAIAPASVSSIRTVSPVVNGITNTVDPLRYHGAQINPGNAERHALGDVSTLALRQSANNWWIASPSPSLQEQGYDDWDTGTNLKYNAALNIDPGLTGQPVVTAEATIVKAVSFTADVSNTARSPVRQFCPLTIVRSAPPAGSFMPPAACADKTPWFNVSQLIMSRLQNLPAAGLSSPPLAYSAQLMNKLQFHHWQHTYNVNSRNVVAQFSNVTADKAPVYGGDFWLFTEIMLALNYDHWTAPQKLEAVIKLVSMGIQIAGRAEEGAVWQDNGGHCAVRKLLVAFASFMLGNPSRLEAVLALTVQGQGAAAKPSPIGASIWADDSQIGTITQALIDQTQAKLYPYTQGQLGWPEFAQEWTRGSVADQTNHQNAIDQNTPKAPATPDLKQNYRHIIAQNMIPGILALQIMGAKATFNNPVVFDYYDRHMEVRLAFGAELPDSGGNDISAWVRAAWVRDRALGDTVWQSSLPVIAVTAGSLKLPDGNHLSTNTSAPSYVADGANWAPAGQDIFQTDSAFIIAVDIPWEVMDTANSQIYGICGNRANGTLANTLGIWCRRGLLETDPCEILFELRDNANTVLAGTITASITKSRYVLAIRRDGAQIHFEAYGNGTLHQRVSPAMGAYGAGRLRSQLIYGAIGSGTTNGYWPSGSFRGFPGSIGDVGYATQTVTEAMLQEISLGRSPLLAISATNWRMFRELRGTDGPSLAAVAGVTGDTTPAMVVLNTRNLTFRKGCDLFGHYASAANHFAVDRIADGFVFSHLRDQLVNGKRGSRIFLSGRNTGFTGLLQVRVFDENGQLRIDWTDMVNVNLTAGATAWNGYVDCPFNAGFGHIDVRVKNTPSALCRIRARTGAGLGILPMAQSQGERCLTQVALGTLPGTAALSVCMSRNRVANVNNHGLSLLCVTGERRVSDGLAGVSAWLPSFTTAPVMIISGMESGTGMDQLVNDSETNRFWNTFESVVNRASGAIANRRIGAGTINWLTNNANGVSLPGGGIVGNYIEPLFFGERRTPGATTTFPIDHSFDDALTVPLSITWGVSPPLRYAAVTAGPFDDDTGADVNNHMLGRQQWKAWAQAQGFAYGPEIPDTVMEPLGGPHQDEAFDGHVITLRRMTENALRALGIVTRTDPSLGVATINGGRTEITIPSIRPNGGALQTAWATYGLAVPGGQTTVQGFKVQDGGVGAWSRSGFTAEIVGTTVRLVKSSGAWAAGTKVRYCWGGPLAYGTAAESLRLVRGLLYEATVAADGPGLPVLGGWEATLA